MKKLLYTAVLFTAVTVITFGCNKDEDGTSNVTVRMKDAPGDFQQVNIDVRSVQIHTEQEGWVTLATQPGMYDLLELRNGAEAVLVTNDELYSGHIDQLRLVLGSENTVMVDSLVYPLATPSAEQSGLKIQLDAEFLPDREYVLLLDFDAAQSVVIKGNGEYSLKPVIRMESIIIH